MFEVTCKKRNPSQIDTNMKRVHIENWSTKEKLALASSVLRSGDQNWMSVSRVIRTLGEPNRPPDWFSQKQCAVQYDLLLNNVGTPKRKKRNEKAHENNVDTPGETIVRKLTQERMEELKMLMAEYRTLYLKEKREYDDINLGKADDKLNDIMHKLEYCEKHEDDEEAAFIKQLHEKKQKEAERISALHLSTDHSHPHTPVEVKPTSPLLTSLLQSPSPVLLHRSTGPTISSLLHSAPPVPPVLPVRSSANTTSTSTTLSKLLETPAMIHLPVSDSDNSTSPSKSILSRSPVAGAGVVTEQPPPHVSSSRIDQVQHQRPYRPQFKQHSPQQQQEPVVKLENKLEKKELDEVDEELRDPPVTTTTKIEENITNIKVEVDELTPVILDEAMEVVTNIESEAEPVEIIVETAQQQPASMENKIKTEVPDEVIVESDTTHNQTGESDLLDDQIDDLCELDSHAVEMIVVGPNQSGVISVHHDGSNENLEDEVSVGISPSNDDTCHPITPSDVDIKEETIEITSSELELAADGKLDLLSDEPSVILSSNENNTEIEDANKLLVETMVKSLGDVSASEMKQIIEGAEVIVESDAIDGDSAHEVIAEQSNVNESINSDNKGEIVEVTTTTVTSDSESIIETVVDNVIEVGSTVVDDATVVDGNVVQFTDGDSTVVNLNESDANAVTVNVAMTTDVTVSNSDEHSCKSFENNEAEREPEPDSSSCSMDEVDDRGVTDTTGGVSSCSSELVVMSEVTDKNKTDITAEEVSKTLPPLPLSVLTSAAATVPSAVTSSISCSIAPATIEAVTSSSRPDTPSTEEDNEPVANLVKRLPRKTSDSIPNSPISNTTEDGASLRAWKKSIMLVYNRLATHKFASLFLKPITDEQAHGYHSVIHRPMDLSTIKKNIESGILRTTVEFQRDMLLMFQNAIMYNSSTTLVYERASEMQKECIQHMQLMVEAMGEGVPLRRESLVVDKLNTRQRGSSKQDTVVDIPSKRKRTQVTSMASDSPVAKRRKVDDPL
ncbi:bromodomain containing 8 isoform X2 [Lycorma delicatula]|uniref:bromodomain containing 8 isoform X2 n=1 Tax=Lycorma delicatula TaxID=130591 RepID=UPI003F51615C